MGCGKSRHRTSGDISPEIELEALLAEAVRLNLTDVRAARETRRRVADGQLDASEARRARAAARFRFLVDPREEARRIARARRRPVGRARDAPRIGRTRRRRGGARPSDEKKTRNFLRAKVILKKAALSLPALDGDPSRRWREILRFDAPARDAADGAVTKLHGAFKVHFLCAQRGAGVLLNISAKFWRISSPD